MSSVMTHPWGSSSDATSLHLSWQLPLPWLYQLCAHITATSSCLLSHCYSNLLETSVVLLILYPKQPQCLKHRRRPNIFWIKESETMWGGMREWEWEIRMVTLVKNFNLLKVKWGDKGGKMTALTVDLCFRILPSAYIQAN